MDNLMVSGMLWLALILIGRMLIPMILLGLAQYLIYTKVYRWRHVLPILSLVLLVVMLIRFSMFLVTLEMPLSFLIFLYYLILFIPYYCPCIVIFSVSAWAKRKHKKDDLERMKINDL